MFEARVLSITMHRGVQAPYDELVHRFGLTSPAQAANILITAKRMHLRHLRGVVGEYTESDDDINAEIGDLQQTIAACGQMCTTDHAK